MAGAKETLVQWRMGLRPMAVAFAFGLSACALDYAKEDGFFDRAQAKDSRSEIQELHKCPPGKHWATPKPEQCKPLEVCPKQCIEDVPRP